MGSIFSSAQKSVVPKSLATLTLLFLLTQVYLTQPPLCPNPLFSLMMKCWSRDIKDRPAFEAIHLFLVEQMDGSI